jgi:hypothetical protein
VGDYHFKWCAVVAHFEKRELTLHASLSNPLETFWTTDDTFTTDTFVVLWTYTRLNGKIHS